MSPGAFFGREPTMSFKPASARAFRFAIEGIPAPSRRTREETQAGHKGCDELGALQLLVHGEEQPLVRNGDLDGLVGGRSGSRGLRVRMT